MTDAWTDIDGPSGDMLLIADHASNHVPSDIRLDVPQASMDEHVAWDIGVAALARLLCDRLGCPAILGGVSRLVIDLNREEDAPGLIPETSDGLNVPGNMGLSEAERRARVERFWRPYHSHIAECLSARRRKLLISLHSFTPRLASEDVDRPWQIGILYNEDDRAARIALPLLADGHIVAGDNLPYSGKVLNATMNQHGEANGIPYLGIEVRQDLIGDVGGCVVWADRLAPVIRAALAGVSGR